MTRAPPSAKPGFRKRPGSEDVALPVMVIELFASKTLALTLPYWRWLKTLYASALNSRCRRSVRATIFVRLVSMLLMMGVRAVKRPRVPIGQGTGAVQACRTIYSAADGLIGALLLSG